MAWSYDPSKFTDATAGVYTGSTRGVRNQIRFLIQDNQINRQLIQDEEIDWLQTQEMNPYMAAAAACDCIIGRFGNIVSKKISEFSITYSPSFYRELSGRLRARGQSYQTPYCGGISIADKAAQQADIDWVTPFFGRGLHDNPAAPTTGVKSVNPVTVF